MSQEELLLQWPPDGTYDFLHSLWSDKLGRTLGIAFINFVTPEMAAQFCERWHGRRIDNGDANKALVIEASKVQGRNANLQQVKLDAAVLPFVLFGDQQVGPSMLGKIVERAKLGTCPVRV